MNEFKIRFISYQLDTQRLQSELIAAQKVLIEANIEVLKSLKELSAGLQKAFSTIQLNKELPTSTTHYSNKYGSITIVN